MWQPNVCPDPGPVPPAVAEASFETEVTVTEMAGRGLPSGREPRETATWWNSTSSLPYSRPRGNEERSLAVIEEIVRLAPGKPIRWVISSAPALRPHRRAQDLPAHRLHGRHAHEQPRFSSTLTCWSTRPRTVEPDIVSMWPPTELSEGYNYEAIQENYVITDDSRILRVYYVQPLQHVSGMLMAYLPEEGHRIRSGSLRHARAPSAGAAASDAELLQPDREDGVGGVHHSARPRGAGALVGVCGGAEFT